MIPTGNLNTTPTGGTEGSQRRPVIDPNARQTAASVDDGKKGKPFREVLDKKLSDKDSKKAATVASKNDEDEEPSLFDLASQTGAVKKTKTIHSEQDASQESFPQEVELVDEEQMPTDKPVGTPVAKMPDVPVRPARKETSSLVAINDTSDVTVSPKSLSKPLGEKLAKDKPAEDKPVEDKPAVLPMTAAPAPIIVEAAASVTPSPTAQSTVRAQETIIKLINQMVEHLEKISSPEKTDTSLTLQYPPIFKGVELVITEFSSARKDLNITFNGLTPDARLLIESQANQESLRAALLAKGYNLQMVTIEQKIPGLQSLNAGGVAAEDKKQTGSQRETATDEDTAQFT